jgi:acyl-CoA thioester hydrolase
MVDSSAGDRGGKTGPSLEEALAMPRTLEATVEQRFIDLNGHMNVAWYVYLFDRATWVLFERLGIDEAYRTRANAGIFAAEEHLRYLGELREGDPLEVHSRVLEVRPKSLRLMHVMTDPARHRIAATAEVVGVHVDYASRRSVALHPELLARMQAQVPAGAPLDDAGAQRFARAWIEAWNRRDVEAVLAHFADDATFISPKAEVVVGQGRLENKADLRRYWESAMAQVGRMHFVLEAALWSPTAHALTISYETTVDDQPPRRAGEILRFRGDRVVAGEALYGATVTWR